MYSASQLSFRRAIWERDGGACGICGDPVTLDCMDLDHVVHRSKGGAYEAANLRPTHPRCNRARSCDAAYLLSAVSSPPRILRRTAPYLGRPLKDEHALLPLGTVVAALGYSEAALRRLSNEGLIPSHERTDWSNGCSKRVYRVSEVSAAIERLARKAVH